MHVLDVMLVQQDESDHGYTLAVRVWCIADAYREILLGENFKILSRFARRLGHV